MNIEQVKVDTLQEWHLCEPPCNGRLQYNYAAVGSAYHDDSRPGFYFYPHQCTKCFASWWLRDTSPKISYRE